MTPDARVQEIRERCDTMETFMETFLTTFPWKDWDASRVMELVEEQRFLLSSLDARERRIEELEKELNRFRLIRHVEGSSHSTGCWIWGDDGRGLNGGPCNCGALINYHRLLLGRLVEAAEHWRNPSVYNEGCTDCRKSDAALTDARLALGERG